MGKSFARNGTNLWIAWETGAVKISHCGAIREVNAPDRDSLAALEPLHLEAAEARGRQPVPCALPRACVK